MQHVPSVHGFFCEVCGKPYNEIKMEESSECDGGKVVDIRHARFRKWADKMVGEVIAKMSEVD